MIKVTGLEDAAVAIADAIAKQQTSKCPKHG